MAEDFARYEFEQPKFWFLQLGKVGFPVANYPFSHVQFNEMGRAKDSQVVLSVSFATVFQKALECLRLKGDKEKEAWERLDKFLQTIDAMSFNTVSRREKEFIALFANEVVIPLTGSTCLINSKPEIKDKKGKTVKLTYDENLKLPEEMRKLSDDVKGLVIGSKRAYYGELDLIVFPPGSKGTDAARESKSVAVACSSDSKAGERSSEESEPEDNEKDNSPGKTVVEDKSTIEGIDGKGYYQAIAELFMFSKIQRLRHKDEGDEHAFPMLVINPQDVVILIYHPESDTLVISEYLEWGRIAYFFVWAVLHHNIFPIKLSRGVKCGYQSIAPPLDLENVWYLCSKGVLHDEPPPLTRKYLPSKSLDW